MSEDPIDHRASRSRRYESGMLWVTLAGVLSAICALLWAASRIGP